MQTHALHLDANVNLQGWQQERKKISFLLNTEMRQGDFLTEYLLEQSYN